MTTTENKLGSYLPSRKVPTEKKDKRRDIFPAAHSIADPDSGRRKSQYNHSSFISLGNPMIKCYLLLASFGKIKGVTTREANKLKFCCYKSRLLFADLSFHHVSASHLGCIIHITLSFILNMPTVVIAPGRQLETCIRK